MMKEKALKISKNKDDKEFMLDTTPQKEDAASVTIGSAIPINP